VLLGSMGSDPRAMLYRRSRANKKHSTGSLGGKQNAPVLLGNFVFCFSLVGPMAREKNSCLGFFNGIKHSFTRFALILSLISLTFSRVLSGLLASC
jgi:hypothetical protein